jgi:hypothetical protein
MISAMKHQRTLLFLAPLLAIAVLHVTARSEQPADAPGPLADRAFLAHLKIALDPKAASDYGVDPKRVDEVISDFAAKHDAFTLNDLQNLKIPAGPDKSLLLSEIATIDVQFNQTPAKP